MGRVTMSDIFATATDYNFVHNPQEATGVCTRHQPYAPMVWEVPSMPKQTVERRETKPYIHFDPHAPPQAFPGSLSRLQPIVAGTATGNNSNNAAGKNDRQKKAWVQIDTTWVPGCQAMETFPRGFSVNVYDGRLINYFEVPSEWVVPTMGGLRYIDHFNETGPYSRFRFQLCQNYLSARCKKGFTCSYVHAKRLPPAHAIHVQGADSYERLPAGLSLIVPTPGSTDKPQLIPSQFIIRTVGAERLFADVIENHHGTSVHPQHCAHFLFKKLCNRGPECAFIHALMVESPSRSVPSPVSL